MASKDDSVEPGGQYFTGTTQQPSTSHSAEFLSRPGLLDGSDLTSSVSACEICSAGKEGYINSKLTQEQNNEVVSFVRAVHLKYHPENEEPTTTDDIVIIHTTGNIVKTTSSGNISLPKQVSMSGQEISVAGDLLAIEKMCARVTELDLMENNISSWEEVFSIITSIPHLTFLNLTSNRLICDASSLTSVRSQSLPSLTHLVLNNTGITWDIVAQLLEIFPKLVELHLSFNKYQTVELMTTLQRAMPASEIQNLRDPPTETECSAPAGTEHCMQNQTSALSGLSSGEVIKDHASSSLSPLHYETGSPEFSTLTATPLSSPCFPTLRRLFFGSNAISDWDEINKLGRCFPNLEYLLLSENHIPDLGNPENIPQCFSNLKSLSLGHTQLRSWAEVEKLACFPMLSDVRLSGIPFLESLPKDIRFQHTVALLPDISTLNGSKVTDSEREDAERAFLRTYMESDPRPSRYYELEEKYGRLDPLAKVELKPQRTVKIKIRVEDGDNQVIKQEDMDIEVDQTVRALRKLLSVIAGKPAAKLTLFYMDNQINQGLDRLIYLERKLHAYNMTDGDEIIVAWKC